MSTETEQQQRVRRRSTMECAARMVSALLICGQQNVRVMADKSDMSERTAARILKVFVEEGLVRSDKHIDNPHITLYTWTGRDL